MCNVDFLHMTSTHCTVCVAYLFIIIEEWVHLEAKNCGVDQLFRAVQPQGISEEMYNLIFVNQKHRLQPCFKLMQYW